MHLSNIEIAAAVVIGVLSVARTARLLVHDVLPPVVWLRIRWDNLTHRSNWNKLLHCHYCLTPWLMAGMCAWFYLGGEHWTWWVVNGWWGASYLAAMAVSYDEPPAFPDEMTLKSPWQS